MVKKIAGQSDTPASLYRRIQVLRWEWYCRIPNQSFVFEVCLKNMETGKISKLFTARNKSF